MTKTVLILGATSSIARAAAEEFAKKGYQLILAARDQDELARIAADLTIRLSVHVQQTYFVAEDFNSHHACFAQVLAQTDSLSGILLAFGYLGTAKPGVDLLDDLKIINSNFTAAVSLLTLFKEYFIKQSKGFIIAISSVAADRGRQSNYLYGSAKAGLSTYLQGLRNELYCHNIKVITIKPGFVDTKMTFDKPGLFLVASPHSVGKQIADVTDKKRDIIYIPWFWRYIMLIIKLIPETIFKKLNL